VSSERRASRSPELLPSLPFAARVQRDSSLAERFVLIPNQHRITSRYYKSSDQIFDDLQQCLDQVEDGGQEIYVSFIQLHLALARRLPSRGRAPFDSFFHLSLFQDYIVGFWDTLEEYTSTPTSPQPSPAPPVNLLFSSPGRPRPGENVEAFWHAVRSISTAIISEGDKYQHLNGSIAWKLLQKDINGIGIKQMDLCVSGSLFSSKMQD